jgi:uncharacterized protein YjiS (DUF1127 family)
MQVLSSGHEEEFEGHGDRQPSPAFTRLPHVAFVRHFTLHRAVLLLALWYERHLQRHDLALLDARMLRDLGLDADEARRECAKPFWR